ncbi:MAG: hypothetical protein WB476_11845, partial [Azonexus sp.]
PVVVNIETGAEADLLSVNDRTARLAAVGREEPVAFLDCGRPTGQGIGSLRLPRGYGIPLA